jgi:hypothetical protein
MTPVLKKNKDRQNPANYRGITVTKIFTKIIQSILNIDVFRQMVIPFYLGGHFSVHIP